MQQAREIAEQIGVKTVYGEPVVSGDKTVVPVASVAFGGGGGGGRAHDPERGKGGGGGFGLRGWPAGYIEITPAGTRYVPVVASPKLAAAVLLGFAAGYILARLQRR
jgi:uncharacterized spore protein YtfJ